jgi:hypothetical protein
MKHDGTKVTTIYACIYAFRHFHTTHSDYRQRDRRGTTNTPSPSNTHHAVPVKEQDQPTAATDTHTTHTRPPISKPVGGRS